MGVPDVWRAEDRESKSHNRHTQVTQTVETVEKACPEQVAETLSKGGENLTTNVA